MNKETLIELTVISAEIEAIKIEIIGMIAENRICDFEKKPPAFGHSEFLDAANEIRELIKKLEES